MSKKQNLLTISLLALAINTAIADGNSASSQPAYQGKSGSVFNDKLYYSIGGGTALPPTEFRGRRNEINVGLGWSSDFSCGNFDLLENVKASINGDQIKNSVRGLLNNFFGSVKAAVASMPAQILQRANPQLYDQLQSSMYQAKLDFDNLTTSCEETSDFLADKLLDQGLMRERKAKKLQNLIEAGEKNISDAKDKSANLKNDDLNNPWQGNNAKSKQVQIVADAVKAGFNGIQHRSADDNSVVPANACQGEICRAFPSPSDASNFAKDVLGEYTFSAHKESVEEHSSGNGLSAQVEKETNRMMPIMEEALNADNITDEQLAQLNSSSLKITRNALNDIKESSDAALLATKITSEIGFAKTMQKALLIRRMLLNAYYNPQAESSYKEMLDKKMKLLDSEIQQLKLEYEMQKTVGNDTILAAIEDAKAHRKRNAIANYPIGNNEMNLDKKPVKIEGIDIIDADRKQIKLNYTTDGSGVNIGTSGNVNLNGPGGTKGGLPIFNRTEKTTYIPQPDGSYIARKGDRSWANNNPGNIECGSFAKNNGAIGCDGRFAIFPNQSAGMGALNNLLASDKYGNLNMHQAIHKYAPAFENNTQKYYEHLKKTGIDPNKKLNQMTPAERDKLAHAIKAMEGGDNGVITHIPAPKK